MENDGQLDEKIMIYENKIKLLMEKIRDELQRRKKLKSQIEDAQKRQATQLQILERLNEYEKLVYRETGLINSMKDEESRRMLDLIDKYEKLLHIQEQKWFTYKQEYDKLPLAIEARQSEIQFKKVRIQYLLLKQQLKETKEMFQMREKIARKREQNQIIEIAKMYMEQTRREKTCKDMIKQTSQIKISINKLKSEIQALENQVAEQESYEPLIRSESTQNPPQIDFSYFNMTRLTYDFQNAANYDNADTISCNTLLLEEEYMSMDVDTEEEQNNPPNKTNDKENIESVPKSKDCIHENNSSKRPLSNSQQSDDLNDVCNHREKKIRTTADKSKSKKDIQKSSEEKKNSQETKKNSQEKKKIREKSNINNENMQEPVQTVNKKRAVIPLQHQVNNNDEQSCSPKDGPPPIKVKKITEHHWKRTEIHEEKQKTISEKPKIISDKTLHESKQITIPTPTLSSPLPTASLFSEAVDISVGLMESSLDNVSGILGSEISEPGGTAGLIKKIHGDSDMSDFESNFDLDEKDYSRIKFPELSPNVFQSGVSFKKKKMSDNSNANQQNENTKPKPNFIFGAASGRGGNKFF